MFAADVRTVALVAGPLVAMGYLAGSLPLAYLWRRDRLRRSLDAGEMPSASRRDDSLVITLLEGLMALAAAHLAWQVMVAIAPAGRGGGFENLSAIAFLSEQGLTVWQSVALWTGFAAVVGQVASPWLGFRGGTGLAPALVISFVYLPTVFSAGGAGFFAGLLVTGRRSPAIIAGVAGAVLFTWLGWVFDWNPGWGVNNGPETCLWAVLTGLVLVARNLGPLAAEHP